MNISSKKLKGFTLMEVLVSAVIFSVVMVITTGVIAQGSTYGTKIKAMRETSEETRRLADMITRDVRSANVATRVMSGDVISGITYHNYKNGIVLFNCTIPISSCSIVGNLSPIASTTPANTLLISTKNSCKVYRNNVKSDGRNYVESLTMILSSGECTLPLGSSYTEISSPNNDTKIDFSGFAPEDTSVIKQQPYIQFMITSKTKGFDTLSPTQRAQAELRGMVTGRSFNQ
jgi:prepilin-type N-terminal cleavage/methylation domain-containing protein